LKDGSRHSCSCFIKISNWSKSYVSGVVLQSCYDRSLFWEDIKTKFWSGANTTWENLKEGVWGLGSANTLSRLSYKSVVCNHVLNIIQNINTKYVHIRKTHV
jgi:hypothetical protein